MQKYKIAASKSQKRYSIILSAENEAEARERLHKEGYSILTIWIVDSSEIKWQKFHFQVEKNGDIKNGVIVWNDIYKAYIKLRDELEYRVLAIYPDGDAAASSVQKQLEILKELEKWYDIQQKWLQNIKKTVVGDHTTWAKEKFYLKKQLDQTYKLIENVLAKFEYIFAHKNEYDIDEATLQKLHDIYNALVHIKSSTNIEKLKEVGELALVKIAKIELKSVELKKDDASRHLLKETNDLLKDLGSHERFIESDKDIKKIFKDFGNNAFESFSLKAYKKRREERNKRRQIVDKDSYDFVKTTLLLDRYKQKKKENNKEIFKNIVLFINPFSSSEQKEKLLLRKRVIVQNITLLQAKKSGWVSSYTDVKKWYHKLTENIINFFHFLGTMLFISVSIYSLIFLLNSTLTSYGIHVFAFNPWSLRDFLLLFILFFMFSMSRNLFLFWINIVFFVFLFIFSRVNF